MPFETLFKKINLQCIKIIEIGESEGKEFYKGPLHLATQKAEFRTAV
jgi:hypothetical protein